MNWTFEKHFITFWFRKHIHGFTCENFCRTMTSDSKYDQSSSKNCVIKSSQGEATTKISRSQLLSFLHFVKFDKLSSSEQSIHTKHLQALENDEETYKDPVTGYIVFTRLAHLRRGVCCGSACRHCPYNHKEVPADKRKKIYNSAFFV